jgi:hypothetical protein
VPGLVEVLDGVDQGLDVFLDGDAALSWTCSGKFGRAASSS